MIQTARGGWTSVIAALILLWLPGCARHTVDKAAEENSVLRGRVIFTRLRNLNLMLQRPPVHERRNGPIAVIYKSSGELDFLKALPRSFLFSDEDIAELEQVSADGLIPDYFGEHLFLRMINEAGFVKARGYTRTHGALANHFGHKGITGHSFRYEVEEALPLVKDLARLGNAWILLVKEVDISDYSAGRRLLHGAKGTTRNEQHVLAYASFQVGLIDTESGKLKDFDFHIQVTVELIPDWEWKGGFADLKPEEQTRVIDAVMARIQENVRQTLLIYKIIPLRGDEFMTLDDLEKDEIFDLNYPD